MSKETDLIYDWVDKATIASEFPEGLAVDEKDVAIGAVQASRVQLVVDSLAQELYKRDKDLQVSENELSREMASVKSEREIIGGALGFNSNKSRLEDLSDWTEEMTGMLTNRRSLGDHQVEELFKNIPPFSIEYAGEREPSLRGWIEKNRTEIRKQYGSKDVGSAMSRMAGVMERVFTHLDTPSMGMLIEQGIIADVVSIDREGRSLIKSFIVADPFKFHEHSYSFSNCGPKSLVALLCIADMQQRAREQ